MDKIKTVKIKNEDGTVSEESYSISVDAINVDMSNGKDLQDTVGDINVDEDGSIAEQLKNIKKKIYYYNTVADMKVDIGLKVGDMAITLGYYQINDGGGAEYNIIAGNYADDGGSYHKLNNNLFAKLMLKDMTNPEIFGAKRDGQTDDSMAFQNAVNYCQENKNILQLMGRYLFYPI